jgi:hypothetical protein
MRKAFRTPARRKHAPDADAASRNAPLVEDLRLLGHILA